MTDSADWAEDALLSESPSNRLRAATWAKAHPNDLTISALIRALQSEPVLQIRRILNDVIEARQIAAERPASAGEVAGASPNAIPSLARLIRHELSPPIGWIRRAGSREIDDFAGSATNDALNRLERRIDALIALIKSDSGLEIGEIDLERLLRETWPDFTTSPQFAPAPDAVARTIVLWTDVGLLEMLLANAFQNAIDASSEVAAPLPINVSWGEASGRFWIRISNAFAGNQFDIGDVQATGISTKVGHQGAGISLIKSASARMGYGFKVSGRSGAATFTLTGGVDLR